MTDTNYLYEYFLTHSPETKEKPTAAQQEVKDNENDE